jgi:hypothetical protein
MQKERERKREKQTGNNNLLVKCDVELQKGYNSSIC